MFDQQQSPESPKLQGQRVVAWTAFLVIAGAGLGYCTDRHPRDPAKLPLGKETTYVTGPLDKEGYIDYEAALNDRLGKGISPEKNATVLLWKALGPTPKDRREMPAEYFRRLGIDAPPRRGAYFIWLDAYLRKQPNLDQDKRNAIDKQVSWAGKRPWRAGDYPHVVEWLKANEKPLAVVIEATKRPDYFFPSVSRKKEHERGTLVGVSLEVYPCRELALALAARATLQVGEGKFDAAWQDLLACHRLGRLLARGGIIETLVGIAIDQIASSADLAYLDRIKLTPIQFQERLKDLQKLPPMPSLADKIDLGERFCYLDMIQGIRHDGVGILGFLVDGKLKKLDAEELKALEQIDWETPLRNGNRWYDRLAAALRHKDRKEREKELVKIEEALDGLKDWVTEPIARIKAQGKISTTKMSGKEIGDILLTRTLPPTGPTRHALDKVEQTQRNLHVAFALAGYYSEHGRYPAQLADLAPKYLPAIPGDLFSGKSLIFRSTEKSYLVYSVGVNGRDERGRSFEDIPFGDDLRVRMPLPELKRKQ